MQTTIISRAEQPRSKRTVEKTKILEGFGSAISQFEDQKGDGNKFKRFVAGGESISTSGALQVVPRADVTCAAKMAGNADENPVAARTLCRHAVDDVPGFEKRVACHPPECKRRPFRGCAVSLDSLPFNRPGCPHLPSRRLLLN